MARRHNAKGRSKYPEGQFWPLPYSMVQHPVFRSLSGPALKVLIELRCRYTVRGDGKTNNNGELRLPYEEAARELGIGKATAKRAFDELELKGFIGKVRQGQWYGRRATEWRVTELRFKGEPASRDWQRFQLPEKTKVGTQTDHIEGLTGPL